MVRALKIYLILIITMVVSSSGAFAQRVAISTNAIEWGILAPNISGEITLSTHSSMTMDLTIDPKFSVSDRFKSNNNTMKYSYRRWFKQAMSSHFVGVNMMFSTYDVRFMDHYYWGNIVGAGITYGYSWVLNSRINIVPTIGVGGGYIGLGGFIPVVTDFGVRIQYVIK